MSSHLLPRDLTIGKKPLPLWFQRPPPSVKRIILKFGLLVFRVKRGKFHPYSYIPPIFVNTKTLTRKLRFPPVVKSPAMRAHPVSATRTPPSATRF
jgi:hypothetical protein